MPYSKYSRKSYRKKPYRKYYSKPSTASKYLGYAHTAIKALSLAKYAVSVINPEKKIFDTLVSGNVTASTGQTLVLTNMDQGVTNNTRNGNSIKAANIQFRLTLKSNTASTAVDNIVRAIMWIDTNQDENSALPDISDLLEFATNVNSPLKTSRIGRFRILADRTVTLANPTAGGMSVKHINIFKKLRHHLRYSGSGTTPDVLRQGQIYIGLITNQATNVPQFTYYSRFKYYDN